MAQQHHHDSLSQHTSQHSSSNDETQRHDPEPKHNSKTASQHVTKHHDQHNQWNKQHQLNSLSTIQQMGLTYQKWSKLFVFLRLAAFTQRCALPACRFTHAVRVTLANLCIYYGIPVYQRVLGTDENSSCRNIRHTRWYEQPCWNQFECACGPFLLETPRIHCPP